jgi:hypothetical protein
MPEPDAPEKFINALKNYGFKFNLSESETKLLCKDCSYYRPIGSAYIYPKGRTEFLKTCQYLPMCERAYQTALASRQIEMEAE